MTAPAIKPLTALEREAIIEALLITKGHKPQVAEALGISLKTLYNRLHQYDIPLKTGINGALTPTTT